jgi:hypothetical protein
MARSKKERSTKKICGWMDGWMDAWIAGVIDGELDGW